MKAMGSHNLQHASTNICWTGKGGSGSLRWAAEPRRRGRGTEVDLRILADPELRKMSKGGCVGQAGTNGISC